MFKLMRKKAAEKAILTLLISVLVVCTCILLNPKLWEYIYYYLHIEIPGLLDELYGYKGGTQLLNAIGILVIIATLIWFFGKCYARDVMETVKKSGIPIEVFDNDICSGFVRNNIIVGKKYMLCVDGLSYSIYKLKNIIWAYGLTNTTEHRLYGVLYTGKSVSRSIVFTSANKQQHSIYNMSDKKMNDILEYLQQTQPHMIIGYNDRLMQIYERNFNQILNMCAEKNDKIIDYRY